MRPRTNHVRYFGILAGAIFVCLSLIGQPQRAQNVTKDSPIVLDGFNGSLVDVAATSSFGMQRASGVDIEQAKFAAEVSRLFPQGDEVFLALHSNPLYVGNSRLTQYSAQALSIAFSESPQQGFNSRTFGGSNTAGRVVIDKNTYNLTDHIFTSPLVLDLKGDGVFSPAAGRYAPHPGRATGPFAAFDIDGDGFVDITEWAGAGYGFLATTPNPVSGRDLVGSPGGWPDGFVHLGHRFDSDHDGIVAGSELNNLYVFEDKNGNGRADEGEVNTAVERGVESIETTHNGYLGRYVRNGQMLSVWDFWPSYSRANRVSTEIPTQAAGIKLGRGQGVAVNSHNEQLNKSDLLTTPTLISTDELISFGITPANFELWSVADGGRVIVGSDRTGIPERARVWAIHLHRDGRVAHVNSLILPFEAVFQVALTPRMDQALVLGDNGAAATLVQIKPGNINAKQTHNLRALGLRASGVAGYARSRGFWFTAWRLDRTLAAVEHRIYEVGQHELRPGLSLDEVEGRLGTSVNHYITGPDSGFFTTLQAGGAERLWHVQGATETEVAVADAFGGLSAIDDQVVFSARTGSAYILGRWRSGDYREIGRANQPIFYPFTTPDGASIVAATLSTTSREIEYLFASETTGWTLSPLLKAYPGTGKIADEVMVHFGPDGISVLLLPASPTR